MESGPVLTIADLRQASNTNWCQDVELSFAFRRGEPLKVLLAPGLVLPKALFKFQLQQAVFEGTCNTGVRWWCQQVAFPVGTERKSSFDMSVRFCCRHARHAYRKRATDDSRKSKHTCSSVHVPAAPLRCKVVSQLKLQFSLEAVTKVMMNHLSFQPLLPIRMPVTATARQAGVA